MADQFWLQDDDDSLILDVNVQEFSLGSLSRDYKIERYAGSNGGTVKGVGSFSDRKFTISRKEKAQSGDTTAFNQSRLDFLKIFTKERWNNLYLHMLLGDGTKEYKTLVIPTDIDSDNLKSFLISESKKITFVSPSGIFENINQSSGSLAITGSDVQSLTITNNGILPTPCRFGFTPTSDETLFRCYVADNYGFQLEFVTFTAGKQILFNTANSAMTIDGQDVQTSQYLSSGGLFNLKSGDNTVYVKCSGAGTFNYYFYDRII